MGCSPPGPSAHGILPGKNTGVGCHALLQGIFPTQGWNPRLLRWQVDYLPLSHQGNPSGIYLKFTFRWVCETSLLNRRVLRCLNKRILVLNVKDKNQGLCSIVNESQDDLIWRCRAFFSSTSYCCQINNSQERGQMLKRLYFPLLVMPAFDLECV